MPKYFDVHTHVHFDDYNHDCSETVQRALDDNVWMTMVGTNEDLSRQAIDLATRYDEGVYATVGLHPNQAEEGITDVYRELAGHEKVVAIGECGLDYFRSSEADTKDVQFDVFIKQIELANELGKPLMVHVRNAYEDAYRLLKEHAKVQADIHFFAGDWSVAKKFLDIGCMLSFTGVVTFTNDYDEVVKNMPFDRIMSETDAPYVAPVPHRGKRNEPVYVIEAVERIAEIRPEPQEEVERQLVENAKRFFGLEKA